MIVLSVFLFGAGTVQHTHAAPLTLAQFQHAIHFDGNCTGAGCEGQAPPPINNCNGGGGTQVTPDYIDSGVDTVTLYQYVGANSGCMWAAVYFNCSGSTCGSNDFVYVTALGEWENSCDGSNYGGLDAMPVKMSNSHHWESTYMVATGTSDCPNGSNYHAAAYITDIGTSSPAYLQNTDTWYD